MQVVAEVGVSAVSCQCSRGLVIERAGNCSAVPLNNSERHLQKTLWVELFLVGLERAASLSERHHVSMLGQLLLQKCM